MECKHNQISEVDEPCPCCGYTEGECVKCGQSFLRESWEDAWMEV